MIRQISSSSSGTADTASKASIHSQQKLDTIFYKPWSYENKKQQEAMVLLAEWMATAGVSYNSIENKAFARFISFLNPSFQTPSEKTIRKTVLPDIYKKVRNHVQSIINEVVYKCSFSIDFWTLQSAHAFISFAIHFLTDLWEQKVVTLECLPFDDQHTAANISDEIQALLHDWNLFNKIHIAVTDNGSNLVNALTDADLTRVPCAIHTLQLVIGDCKEVQRGVKDLLTKASSMVSHFRNSVKAA